MLLQELDMGSLQQLHKLVCTGQRPQLSVLPAQLRHLDLGVCWYSEQLAAVAPLQQLTALSLQVAFEEQQPLLQLAQLPALRELRLSVRDCEWYAAVASAPAWGQLPQLRALEVYCLGYEVSTMRELAAVVAGAAAATALTKLVLLVPSLKADHEVEWQAPEGVEGGQQRAPLDICASIAGLKRLKHLELMHLSNLASFNQFVSTPLVVPGDVSALTALTGLTYLGLPAGGGCIGDAAAAASCLKQLHHLDLSRMHV
uniref:Uncharacterized protein n=1 Tax=Tetradesmus obliquus TaxID=3088 RepID=A0A383W8Z1_TETOB|eukprot:jgi/Sobl393_1/15745/SZX73156.1